MTDPREKHSDIHAPLPVQQQQFPGSESKMDPKPDYGYKSYKGTGKLTDKVALITGADSGIGRAVALAFAREGADIAIAYLNEHEDARETKKVVEEAGRKVILIPGDIASEEHIKEIVAKTVDTFGRIDILVNNASMQGDAVDELHTDSTRPPGEDLHGEHCGHDLTGAESRPPHEAWKRHHQCGLHHGVSTHPSNPRLCMHKGDHLLILPVTWLQVASIQAYQPTPSVLDYACTKGAIVTLTKALAKDLISKKGIRVNAIAPGPIWTPIPVESFTESMVKDFGKGMTPIDRAGQPAELAPAFVFLANNADSSYVNAEILGVTGGMPLS
ncbi:hypothetical protein WJX75_009866 [Coccomyxa subellipsoidea]|uniref:NAD(P)-binding protein n=1 Tax=Coccomyxa subellipsoidea TaxID=248742 RepID=A0ABR2Z5F5_9CHLO